MTTGSTLIYKSVKNGYVISQWDTESEFTQTLLSPSEKLPGDSKKDIFHCRKHCNFDDIFLHHRLLLLILQGKFFSSSSHLIEDLSSKWFRYEFNHSLFLSFSLSLWINLLSIISMGFPGILSVGFLFWSLDYKKMMALQRLFSSLIPRPVILLSKN